ncbi:lysophospholipid acyltransferase family protein [Consotaella salsifontis]|uniref:1-acyl-sn-glycerol-3-phosphate acyltransferase n=1 Tax=Consotaella salsifontis TaxID=1365950 RepID=A0A1T4RRF6_9HYPH|nr:lysophospholipid acyltransferase family protein [Consotaella salsifontis]SKA18467.1 1-acyl-sn-glycerol-3-phosphate acyltransferase [Consotaella salsifontis]
MTALRSLAFNVLFYLNLIGHLLVLSPVFFIVPERMAWSFLKSWARSSLWLMKVVAGLDAHITGHENIPQGAVIVASKHQSFWDIMALVPQLDRPTFILKKELISIPVFGWFARRLGMIPVDRSKGAAAIPAMLESAREAAAAGRQIIIFPEGTRTAPGADPDYRSGVFRLYRELKLPVVPVALNSGVFWPRRSFMRWPGTVEAQFLPPLPPGLYRDAFLPPLRAAIEERSTEMLRDAYRGRTDLPMNALVRERLTEGAPLA